MSPLEFDPKAAAGPDGTVRVDEEMVRAALARGRTEGAATTTAGWDQSFPG
jgi:hypothetical protein